MKRNGDSKREQVGEDGVRVALSVPAIHFTPQSVLWY